ncbi:hypothetical protein LXL04_009293 [Taraxacum kok-saghyz]
MLGSGSARLGLARLGSIRLASLIELTNIGSGSARLINELLNGTRARLGLRDNCRGEYEIISSGSQIHQYHPNKSLANSSINITDFPNKSLANSSMKLNEGRTNVWMHAHRGRCSPFVACTPSAPSTSFKDNPLNKVEGTKGKKEHECTYGPPSNLTELLTRSILSDILGLKIIPQLLRTFRVLVNIKKRIRHTIENVASANVVIIVPLISSPGLFQWLIISSICRKFCRPGGTQHIHHLQRGQQEVHLLLPTTKVYSLEFLQFAEF